jgi:transposase
MNPYPEPNSIIVLDNCSTHKSAALREVVEQSGTVLSESIFWSRADKNLQDGCLLIFLPPYSPDYNPIEASFSCCKSPYGCTNSVSSFSTVKWLRRHWRQLQDSEFPEQDLRDACFLAVNGENARGWYTHSGYL